MHDDSELIRIYADSGSEEAFSQLVVRNLGLVYNAALRRTNGDAHLAEDVVQQVFSSLARDAHLVARHAIPAGWLYVATRNAASNLMRSERRRKARETKAMTMQNTAGESDSVPDWERLRPELDAVMDKLDGQDRDAVVLRCLQGKPFAEIGGILRISEEAARKRVGRALEKLRGLLANRGIRSTAGALAAGLSGQSALAAPTGLAVRISGLALATVGKAPCAAGILMSTTYKVGLATAIAIAVAAGGFLFIQHRHEVRSRRQIAEMRLQAERHFSNMDPASARSAIAVGMSSAGKGAAAEQVHSDSKAKVESIHETSWPGLSGGMIKSTDWKNRGTGTPLDAMESYLWAVDRVDVDAAGDSIGFGKWKAQVDAYFAALPDNVRAGYDTPEKYWALLLTGAPHGPSITSYGVVSQAPDPAQPEDGVIVDLIIEKANGATIEGNVQLQLTPAGWRYTLQDNLIVPILNLAGQPK